MRAAAAVYAEHVVPLAGTVRDSAETALPAVDPTSLGTASGTGVTAAGLRHLVPAVSLVTGRRALLPAGAVRTFGAYNRDGSWTPTGAGTGVGGSVREAAARGLLGALSYQALTGAIAGRGRVSRVSLDSLGADAELVFLTRSAKNLGLRLELLDLADDERPAPVLLARAADPLTGEWRWAPGAAVRWRDAAVDAMRDLLGGAQLDRQSADGGRADTGDALLADFDAGTLAVTAESEAGDDAPGGWTGLVSRLRDGGWDALSADTGSADLRAGGLHVVRVVLASGRARAL